ncbi:MAG: aldo/keto reductase [Phycisphaerae bacterium]|nr:aldo/keto reductase [Phycisphaerae bacterium]
MQKRSFGKTGFNVTPLGFGAAPVAYLGTERERAAKVIHQLLDAGVNLIDTAASYPGSESFLGEHVSARRHEFILVSKCGQKIPESGASSWSAEVISATVDRALKQLRTDRLDVMLLHSCSLEVLKKGDAVGALVKARDAGKIRFAGYSGDNEAAAYAASLPDIAVIETSINIADQRNIDLVLAPTLKNGVGVLAKRPIANSAWRSSLPGMYQNYASVYADRLSKMNLSPADLGIDGPSDLAWPELALRFTLSQPGVHTAIIGTTNPANAATNIRLAELPPLPADAVEKIRSAFRNGQGSEQWTGQT